MDFDREWNADTIQKKPLGTLVDSLDGWGMEEIFPYDTIQEDQASLYGDIQHAEAQLRKVVCKHLQALRDALDKKSGSIPADMQTTTFQSHKPHTHIDDLPLTQEIRNLLYDFLFHNTIYKGKVPVYQDLVQLAVRYEQDIFWKTGLPEIHWPELRQFLVKNAILPPFLVIR
ncbi:MAG: hypothetical protein WCG98_00950 [bacterium]